MGKHVRSSHNADLLWDRDETEEEAVEANKDLYITNRITLRDLESRLQIIFSRPGGFPVR